MQLFRSAIKFNYFLKAIVLQLEWLLFHFIQPLQSHGKLSCSSAFIIGFSDFRLFISFDICIAIYFWATKFVYNCCSFDKVSQNENANSVIDNALSLSNSKNS